MGVEVNEDLVPTKAERIAAARADLARRYAENPEAVQRFEARKAHIEAARKRERQRVDRIGRDGRPDDPDLTRPSSLSRQAWKIERGRRQAMFRKAMADWNRRQRLLKLNGPTQEQSAKATYVETNIYDHIGGRRIKIGYAFRREPRFETIEGVSAEGLAALRRYRRTFDTSELSTVKSGLDIGTGGGIGGSEAVIGRLQAVVFADIALNRIEQAVPKHLVQTLRRIALHDDDFSEVAMAQFGSASGQRRTRVRQDFLRAVDALAEAMKPPTKLAAVALPEAAAATYGDAAVAIPAEFIDDRGYMLPWGDIIDIITASLREESTECAI